MSKSIVVLYQSKTGFTEQYAQWISKELGVRALDIRKVNGQGLAACETLVFGGRAHAGKLSGLAKAKKLFRQSGAKHLVIFATGATPNHAQETIAAFWNGNLTPEERASIPHFYMQSGLCYEKMGFVDRLMMKGLSSMLRKKPDLSEEERFMAQAIEKSFDNSSPEHIKPLLNYLENM